MNDFDYDVLQRKRLAHQAFHRKNGSRSKKCPMSTDHMTTKQWKERCGEVVTCQLGKPMAWDEFRQMSASLQKEYLLNLIHKYSATAADLAKMFGITPQTVTRFCGNKEIGIEFSRGKRMPKDCREEFEKFLSHYKEPVVPVSNEQSSIPLKSERTNNSPSCMNMTEFSLCFEGVISPETITNSIMAMLPQNSNVKLEIMRSILS